MVTCCGNESNMCSSVLMKSVLERKFMIGTACKARKCVKVSVAEYKIKLKIVKIYIPVCLSLK